MKFSQLILYENGQRPVWRICIWVLSLKGLILNDSLILFFNGTIQNIKLWSWATYKLRNQSSIVIIQRYQFVKTSLSLVSLLTRKVSQQLAVLKRLRNILPLDIRKNIYHSFIAPHFDYCSDVWHFCSKTTSDKLHIKKSYLLTYNLPSPQWIAISTQKTPSKSIRETESIIH